MTKHLLLPFLCALLSLGCPAKSKLPPPEAGQDPAQQSGKSKSDTTRIMALLVDGSRIFGQTTRESIPVQTAYMKTDIPFALLLSASRDSSNAAFSLMTTNGDRMRATMLFESLELETALGKLSLPLSSVASLTVIREAPGPREGLVAFYMFDGDMKDRSGHQRDAILHGPLPTSDRHGVPGQAYQFNGKDANVELPQGFMTPSIRAFSICTWVKPGDIQLERHAVYIGTREGECDLSTKDGNFIFGVKTTNGNWAAVTSPAASGQCALLVGVYQRGKSIQLWVNGKRVAETPIPDLGLYPGPPVVRSSIGSYIREGGQADLGWDGSIDEVRIYNRALSGTEIEGLYAAGK